MSLLLLLGPSVLLNCICIFRQKAGVSDQVEKDALLLLVFAVGQASSWSSPDIAEGLSLLWGRNVTLWSAFSCWITGWKCQSGLPSFGCGDLKNILFLRFCGLLVPNWFPLPSYHFSEFSFGCLLCYYHRAVFVEEGQWKIDICRLTLSLIFVNVNDLHPVG